MARLADLSPAAKWVGWVAAMFGIALAALRLVIAIDPGGAWATRLEPFANLIVALAVAFFLAAIIVPLVALLRGPEKRWSQQGFRWWCHEFARNETSDDRTYAVRIYPSESVQPASFRIRLADPSRANFHDSYVSRTDGHESFRPPGAWAATRQIRRGFLYVKIAQPPLTAEQMLVVLVRSGGGPQAVGPVEREV